MPSPEPPIESLLAELRQAHPELETVLAVATEPVFAVGGAVRDLLLGEPRSDLDLVVEGDAGALAARLGGGVSHLRFGTFKAEIGGREVDVAAARTERYPHPGALPLVEPAASIEEDLRRRDFTLNAMAIPLRGEARLIDPHDGREDLRRRRLRVLHAGSFADDPTRAIRAARYAARFGLELEPQTEELLRSADLGTVSADRRRSELERLAAEATAVRGFELLDEWGVVELRDGGLELARAAEALLGAEDWARLVARERLLLAAALGPPGGEAELAAVDSPSPAEGVELARGRDPVELALARAMGAAWLDAYLRTWRHVELEIGGEDLLAAGIPPGPAVGRGLRAALAKRLDGEIEGREGELAAALEAARAG
jgi:tRNA nucleotidyltransferase (CCA-adding enzyme)